MAGLTAEGLEIKRFSDITEDLQSEATLIFQDLVPPGDVVNVQPNSLIGREIGLVTPSLSDIWEAIEQVYNAFNINAATGVALDNLVTLGGVVRQPASSTITTVKLTGLVGTEIPLGSKAQGANNGEYHSLLETVVLDSNADYSATITVLTVTNSTDYTINYRKNPDSAAEGFIAVTITSDGSATEAEILADLAAEINSAPHNTLFTATVVGSELLVESIDLTKKFDFTVSANLNIPRVQKISTVASDNTGPIEQPIGTITRIPVPILGWEAVTNPLSGILGRDTETDSELRQRYILAKFGDGQNLIESLYAALFALDGVESVVIVENDTDTTLVFPNPPVPPHSFYVAVLGGESQEIGEAIWANKPAGILSFGANTVTVYDSQGISHSVSFDRPTAVDIYVEVTITVQPNFAPDGVNQIKQAVFDHINALLIGEDVIYSRLYTPINSVQGHYVNSLFIDDAPAPAGMANININFDEKAVITMDNIAVVTV